MIVLLVDEAGWLKALFALHAERDLESLGRESKMEYKRKTPSSEYSLRPAPLMKFRSNEPSSK
jgi:hypothetical protein